MAVTITRSIWVDDDGTGTTGTVINQALHTTLYNEIDTALAKVAQLAGGNAFTGNQSVTGGTVIVPTLIVNTAGAVAGGRVSIVADQAAGNAINIQNSSASNGLGYLGFYNSALGIAGYVLQTGATTVSYVTSSDARLKRDHGRASDLAALRAVVVHDFTWVADDVRDRGVFAQEAHAHYPRAVAPGTDETTDAGALARPWMTDYSKFVPDLIVGWQQHDAELTALRAMFAAVKG